MHYFDKEIYKALIVGNEGTGKSQFMSRYVHNRFNETYHRTIGVNFETKSFQLDTKNIEITFYDLEGRSSIIPHQMRSIFQNLLLIIIVVNVTDNKKNKLLQIKQWINLCYSFNQAPLSCIIIENKLDLLQSNISVLTEEDLMQFKEQYLFHHIVSAKTATNFDTLENRIIDVLPKLIIKAPFIQLTGDQARSVLRSLKNLLFSNKANCTPLQMNEWLLEISSILDGYLCEPSQALYSIYLEIKKAATDNSYRKSTDTQYFYEHTLLKFIERSVKQNNITLRLKIDNIDRDNINVVFKDLIHYLERGTTNNLDKPYDISFFGGKIHSLGSDSKSIKVPGHVYELLTYIHGICKSHDFVRYHDKKIEALVNIFDKILIIMDSLCPNRKPATKTFYEVLLPDFFIRLVESNQAKLNDFNTRFESLLES